MNRLVLNGLITAVFSVFVAFVIGLFNWGFWANDSIRANAQTVAANRQMQDEEFTNVTKWLDHINSTTDKIDHKLDRIDQKIDGKMDKHH